MVKAFQAVSNAHFFGATCFWYWSRFFWKEKFAVGLCFFKEKQAQCFQKFPTRFCLALVQCILWPSLGLRLLLSFVHFLAFMIFLTFSTWY